MLSTYQHIWEATKRIPRGHVATYGDIAIIAKTHPRVVGNALHRNPDPKHIPCHRVVRADGGLASGFAFGGIREQERRLKKEGVAVKNGKVDLSGKSRFKQK